MPVEPLIIMQSLDWKKPDKPLSDRKTAEIQIIRRATEIQSELDEDQYSSMADDPLAVTRHKSSKSRYSDSNLKAGTINTSLWLYFKYHCY